MTVVASVAWHEQSILRWQRFEAAAGGPATNATSLSTPAGAVRPLDQYLRSLALLARCSSRWRLPRRRRKPLRCQNSLPALTRLSPSSGPSLTPHTPMCLIPGTLGLICLTQAKHHATNGRPSGILALRQLSSIPPSASCPQLSSFFFRHPRPAGGLVRVSRARATLTRL